LQTPSDDRALVQKLIQRLRSSESTAAEGGTQGDAAFELGKLGPRAKEAVPALIEALDPKNEDDLRKDVVRALGEIAPSDKRVIGRLAALLSELGRHPDPTDRVGGFLFEEVTNALAKAGPPAIPTLIEKLAIREDQFGEDELGTSGAAAQALGRIGLPALPALLDAIKDRSRRVGAVIALGYLGTQCASACVPALLRHVKDPDVNVRFSVYMALGKIGPAASEAVPALIAALDYERSFDPMRISQGALTQQMVVIETLGQIGPKARAALPRLERLLEETRNDQTGFNVKVKWAIDQILGVSQR
jgi:HEAT repeat protein